MLCVQVREKVLQQNQTKESPQRSTINEHRYVYIIIYLSIDIIHRHWNHI